jgi:hypothetical protein
MTPLMRFLFRIRIAGSVAELYFDRVPSWNLIEAMIGRARAGFPTPTSAIRRCVADRNLCSSPQHARREHSTEPPLVHFEKMAQLFAHRFWQRDVFGRELIRVDR